MFLRLLHTKYVCNDRDHLIHRLHALLLSSVIEWG